MNETIGIIGAGDALSPAQRMLKKVLTENFSKAVGKLIIVHPGPYEFGDIIKEMREINPSLEIELVHDLSGHKDVLIINGSNNAEVARSMEISYVKAYDGDIEVNRLMRKHSIEQRKENRFRSQRHNFNPKNYRR